MYFSTEKTISDDLQDNENDSDDFIRVLVREETEITLDHLTTGPDPGVPTGPVIVSVRVAGHGYSNTP